MAKTIAVLGALAFLAVLAAPVAAQDEAGPSGGSEGSEGPGGAQAAAAAGPACDEDDGGLDLAPGWCARVFASELGAVRNLAVASDGTVYASRKDEGRPAGVALRDADGDGRAERREAFGPHGPAHDVLVEAPAEGEGGAVWLATDRRILRFPRAEGALRPTGDAVAVVEDLPLQRQHARKAIALGPADPEAGGEVLFVNVGAPSNACQEEMRTPRSPGLTPCPQLESHAGIWRFDAEATGQDQADGTRFATGLRHTLALAVHPGTGRLFGVVNGRDQLHSLWGFSVEQNARLPAEEMVAIDRGDDFGWPYCYHDGQKDRKVLAPEYGGDGEEVGRCGAMEPPVLAFPAHWAPMDLAFARAGHGGTGGGDAADPGAPEAYVAYVAFRGSWNRAPLPQEGYRVVRVPFADGMTTGRYATFAIGAESDTQFRFTGVAVGPDGAVYAAAENVGRVWRIVPTSASTSMP
ncbi:MAG: sorbosone dehydrogenase [Myxococcota bacterium]|nr:sorbosone dehydrogenase [Myxococcota bacterium]